MKHFRIITAPQIVCTVGAPQKVQAASGEEVYIPHQNTQAQINLVAQGQAEILEVMRALSKRENSRAQLDTE